MALGMANLDFKFVKSAQAAMSRLGELSIIHLGMAGKSIQVRTCWHGRFTMARYAERFSTLQRVSISCQICAQLRPPILAHVPSVQYAIHSSNEEDLLHSVNEQKCPERSHLLNALSLRKQTWDAKSKASWSIKLQIAPLKPLQLEYGPQKITRELYHLKKSG